MKKSLSTFIVSCLLLTSCATQQVLPNPSGSNSTTTVNNNTITAEQAGFEKSEINGIQFKKADPVAQATGSKTPTTGSGAAPQAAADSGAVSKSAALVSGESASRYFSPYYGGNSFEEYVVTDFEEGVTTGFSGSYLDAYKKIVQPVLKAWSSDTRLVNVSGSTDDKGNNKDLNVSTQIQPYYYDQYRWSLTFASASKKEIYTFYIGEKETYISRQKWGLKNLTPDTITIDSNRAIEIYKEKVADKTFKTPSDQNYYGSTNSELLYTVPDGGTWNFYLQQEKDTLVWNINVYFPTKYENQPLVVASPTPASSATPQTPVFQKPQPIINISYSGGYAKIDAKTGKLIDMSRIVKYTNSIYPYPCPNGYCPEYTSGGVTPAKAL